MAENDPETPTYHVSMWDVPAPTYVCLLCHATGFSLEDVAAHLSTLHAREAVPTPMIPALLAMRAEDDARLAALAEAAERPRAPGETVEAAMARGEALLRSPDIVEEPTHG